MKPGSSASEFADPDFLGRRGAADIYPELDPSRVYIFPVRGRFLFNRDFKDCVFEGLARFYNKIGDRFEVPEAWFRSVRCFLEGHGFHVVLVEDLRDFAVVKLKHSSHPDLLFEEAVYRREGRDFNVFLMKDDVAVERAVSCGARRFCESGEDSVV